MHCWPWRYPAGRRHPSPRWAARWRWCCAAGGESKWGAGSIRVHWSSWCACWRGSEHVRLGRGNANLPGGWSDGHAQGLRGPVWYGAGSLVRKVSVFKLYEGLKMLPKMNMVGFKIALVTPKFANHKDSRFVENVAANTGLFIRYFPDKD